MVGRHPGIRSRGFTHEDGHRTFALSELLVHPDWQSRGIARALHHELLCSRSEERVTLLARPDNAVAQAAYRSWGYRKVVELRPAWQHAPTFDVLVTGSLGRMTHPRSDGVSPGRTPPDRH